MSIARQVYLEAKKARDPYIEVQILSRSLPCKEFTQSGVITYTYKDKSQVECIDDGVTRKIKLINKGRVK